jgi:hypothetical protein
MQLGTAHLALGACALAAGAASFGAWAAVAVREPPTEHVASAGIVLLAARAYFFVSGLFHLLVGRALRRSAERWPGSWLLAAAHAAVAVAVARVWWREEFSPVYLGGLDPLLALLAVISVLATLLQIATWWQGRTSERVPSEDPGASRLRWGWSLLQVGAGIAVAIALGRGACRAVILRERLGRSLALPKQCHFQCVLFGAVLQFAARSSSAVLSLQPSPGASRGRKRK